MKSKQMKNVLLLAIVMTLVSSAFITTSIADYEPLDTHSASLVPNLTQVSVGDQFSVAVYINSGADSITSFLVRCLEFYTTTLWMVNASANPGGSAAGGNGIDLNASFSSTWKAGGIYDCGARNNLTGNYSMGPQAFVAAGVVGNNTAATINFTAQAPGVVYINIPWSCPWLPAQEGLEINGLISDFYTNTSVTIYPRMPTGLTATMYNYTIINITAMVPQAEDDSVVLCGKTGSYPTSPTSDVLDNSTNTTFNHTDLLPCTTYYYRAWGYNLTTNSYSLLNRSAYATTNCYTNFSFAGVAPTNSSKTADCLYDIPVNVTILNGAGKAFRYWINCSNTQTASGTGIPANISIGTTMTGLSHNTVYWWNVTVADTLGDSNNICYNFTTGTGGGTTPGAPGVPTPINHAPIQPINLGDFSVQVTDPDGDAMNVTFYWQNGTVIGYNASVASGGTAHIYPSITMLYGTTYYWYVTANDGCLTTTSSTWDFVTTTRNVSITKQWTVLANNSIFCWINTTNTGESNLTDVIINETYDANLQFTYASPANDSGNTGNWTVPWMNTSGVSKWYNITLQLDLRGRIANGTSITNTAKTITGTEVSSASPTALTMGFYLIKQYHGSVITWNSTTANFSINITNCGSFYLGWIQFNETYWPNLTYNASSITPAGGTNNVTFNITSLAPGVTSTNWILMNINTSAGELVNGTRAYNNLTLTSNQTTPQLSFTMYAPVGGRTTMLRITYDSNLPEVTAIGDNVLKILGVLLVIAAIMMIVAVIYKQGLFGSGGGE